MLKYLPLAVELAVAVNRYVDAMLIYGLLYPSNPSTHSATPTFIRRDNISRHANVMSCNLAIDNIFNYDLKQHKILLKSPTKKGFINFCLPFYKVIYVFTRRGFRRVDAFV